MRLYKWISLFLVLLCIFIILEYTYTFTHFFTENPIYSHIKYFVLTNYDMHLTSDKQQFSLITSSAISNFLAGGVSDCVSCQFWLIRTCTWVVSDMEEISPSTIIWLVGYFCKLVWVVSRLSKWGYAYKMWGLHS